MWRTSQWYQSMLEQLALTIYSRNGRALTHCYGNNKPPPLLNNNGG